VKRLVILMLAGLTAVAVQAADVKLTFVGASNTALENPHDLKLSPNGEYLFVSDVGNNRVAILDPQTLDLIADFGSDHQSGTHDVDFDSRGRACGDGRRHVRPIPPWRQSAVKPGRDSS